MLRRLVLVLSPLLAVHLFGAEPELEFSGLVVADGHTRLALTDKTKRTTDWVEPGGETSGYRVVSYDAKENSVTLRKDGRDYQVPLNTAKVADATVAPPASATLEAVSVPIHNNLRQLAAAAKQFQLEHGGAAPTYADLVGPDKTIKQLQPVDGENYTALAFGAEMPLAVTTAHGASISLETSPALVANAAGPAPIATTSGAASSIAPQSSVITVAPAPANAPAVVAVANPPPVAPVAGSSTATAPGMAAGSPVMPTAPLAPTGITYTIQSGDTLAKIAARTGLSVEQLQTLNPGANATALQPGESIRIR
ncbi:MAG TPA: LysM domain-containing protein [Opitutaceae bacterium]|nr:LysM domain-containing protein [Opitutaceae bacterium]